MPPSFETRRYVAEGSVGAGVGLADQASSGQHANDDGKRSRGIVDAKLGESGAAQQAGHQDRTQNRRARNRVDPNTDQFDAPTGTMRCAGRPARAKPSMTGGWRITFMMLPNRIMRMGIALVPQKPVGRVPIDAARARRPRAPAGKVPGYRRECMPLMSRRYDRQRAR